MFHIRVTGWQPPARDQDGEWEGELPDASNYCRSFTFWDGMSAWPSIWRLAPDVLSTRLLDLAAMDTMEITGYGTETPDSVVQFGCKGHGKK